MICSVKVILGGNGHMSTRSRHLQKVCNLISEVMCSSLVLTSEEEACIWTPVRLPNPVHIVGKGNIA
jgi:hypothetical protein